MKVAGEIFPLTIPGNAKNGLRIKLCIPLANLSEFVLNIDFDAEKSVKKTGNGFKLKPVIKVLNPDVEVEDEGEDEEDDSDEENDSNEENTPQDTLDLPQLTLDYLELEYGGYKVRSIDSIVLCDGTKAIQIVIQDKNDKVNLFFDSAGAFLQKSIDLKKKDISEIILKALEENFKGFKPSNLLFKIIRVDESIQFQLTIRKGNDEKIVLFAADGMVICEF